MANIKMNRGTTYTVGVQYQRNGVSTSLVGATVRFTMKTVEYDDSVTDATALIQKDVVDGTAEGTATIILDPADTATLEPGRYFFDIKVEESTGEIYKIAEGRVTLDGSPTNRGA